MPERSSPFHPRNLLAGVLAAGLWNLIAPAVGLIGAAVLRAIGTDWPAAVMVAFALTLVAIPVISTVRGKRTQVTPDAGVLISITQPVGADDSLFSDFHVLGFVQARERGMETAKWNARVECADIGDALSAFWLERHNAKPRVGLVAHDVETERLYHEQFAIEAVDIVKHFRRFSGRPTLTAEDERCAREPASVDDILVLARTLSGLRPTGAKP